MPSTRGCTGGSAAEPAADPALAGRIAGVRRDGYLDVEANSPIAPAEVVVSPYCPAITSRRERRTVSEPQQGIFGIDLGTTYSVVGLHR